MDNSMEKTEGQTQDTSKEYIKPEITKHKSMAVVSGSDCTYILESEYNYI